MVLILPSIIQLAVLGDGFQIMLETNSTIFDFICGFFFFNSNLVHVTEKHPHLLVFPLGFFVVVHFFLKSFALFDGLFQNDFGVRNVHFDLCQFSFLLFNFFSFVVDPVNGILDSSENTVDYLFNAHALLRNCALIKNCGLIINCALNRNCALIRNYALIGNGALIGHCALIRNCALIRGYALIKNCALVKNCALIRFCGLIINCALIMNFALIR